MTEKINVDAACRDARLQAFGEKVAADNDIGKRKQVMLETDASHERMLKSIEVLQKIAGNDKLSEATRENATARLDKLMDNM